MNTVPNQRRVPVVAMAIVVLVASLARAQGLASFVIHEQRHIDVRDPSGLCRLPDPDTPPPPTVSQPGQDLTLRHLSLDEAIRIALDNSEVVRVLTGVGASSSGRTIYDPAISNTIIDEQKARFDPRIEVFNGFNRNENPGSVLDPFDPRRSQIEGLRRDDYNLDLILTKQTITGATARLGVNTNPNRTRPGLFPLNPQTRSSAEMSLNQPLLKGASIEANLAPIVIGRIDTERSYFQLKNSVQELVRGVIEAYWALVFARTNVWARQQQLEQSQWAYDQTNVGMKVGRKDLADVAQTRVALANFRASLITAKANLLLREDALRNILGLPPSDFMELVPVSPPSTERQEFQWNALVDLAQERRPDLIELKLIIEADEQLLLQARNQALPALDAILLYRWNGLEGEMPNGENISSAPGAFTDWTLGVNFSVPLGLRQSRATLRRQELVIARDWANLRQGQHNVLHQLAIDVRNLDQYYDQYDAFRETRTAARLNLEAQLAQYQRGLTDFLNTLLAISDWGNAVSSEAQSVAQYNTELANLERDTGTILETHGVRFTEERFCAIGPLGRLAHGRHYPSAMRPGPNADRYPSTSEPAEQSFNLEDPVPERSRSRQPELERLPPAPPSGAENRSPGPILPLVDPHGGWFGVPDNGLVPAEIANQANVSRR